MTSAIQIRVNDDSNPYKALAEYEMLERLEKSRAHAVQGMVKDAEKISQDMRKIWIIR